MLQKKKRQEQILEIIEKQDIQTQEELICKLREAGYDVTQATVSRDIRELNLIKGTSAGGVYRYTVPKNPDAAPPKFNSALTESIISVDYAGNIMVIKTFPGLANAVAACVDSLKLAEILGCIAGDDTICVVARTPAIAADLCDKMRHMIRNL